MPELPEVQTVVDTLKNMIIGRKIIDVDIKWNKIIENESIDQFKKDIKNQTINDITRQGKMIIFVLDEYYMLSHLRMEGKYFYSESPTIDKHSHVSFALDNGMYLIYNDVRKFGKISLVKKNELNKNPFLANMGKEPFVISAKELFDKLSKKRIPIKSALLDQSIIAGLGNIYVDEVLFLSRLNPLTPANEITLKQAQVIIDNSIIVLNKAIALGGTTIRSYTSSLGVTGRFQNELNVHTKEKEPCPVCGHSIVKLKVGGRGTYICPVCQNAKIIGLTGNIASGKSAVSSYLQSLGYQIIDTDKITADLYANDKVFKQEMVKAFSKAILTKNKLDKKKVAKIIFNDEKAKTKLEAIAHPMVLEKSFELINASHQQLIIFEVPLLFEAAFDSYCDKVIMVAIDEKLQLERLMKRNNYTKDEALMRINSQEKQSEKIKKADFVIYNNSTLEALEKEVDNVMQQIREEYKVC